MLAGLTLSAALAVAGLELQRGLEANAIEREWQSERVVPVRNIGTTRTLEIVPLVNWHADGEQFGTEPGVAYLVRTDTMTILFDAGFNPEGLRPSPLERNMAALGITMDEVDAVFVSHLHRDHVGGVRYERNSTLSVGASDRMLAGRTMYTPVPMVHSWMSGVTLSTPMSIATGIATTGPIARALVAGRVEEQALVINVEGRGLVVVVGCGHQTLPKLLRRLDDAFDVPLYGLVGDLHYPVPKGRLSLWGIDAQRRLASGEGLFKPIDAETVRTDVDLLASRQLSLIALGGHDTSDEVIAKFKERFDARFRPVLVGDPISLSSDPGYTH